MRWGAAPADAHAAVRFLGLPGMRDGLAVCGVSPLSAARLAA